MSATSGVSSAACVVVDGAAVVVLLVVAVDVGSDPQAARIAMLAVPSPPFTNRRRRLQRDGWVMRANGMRVIVGVTS